MASAGKHLRRAQHHLDVANKLAADPETLAWAAVVLFYAARDIAHAVFDGEPGLPAVCRHPDSHANQDLAKPGTNTVVKRHFPMIRPSYMDLYATSLGVRYEGQNVDDDYFAGIKEDFQEVCRWAAQKLSDAGRRQLPDWLTVP